jgi:glutamate-1-semialdehyde 2,1-aminomutase
VSTVLRENFSIEGALLEAESRFTAGHPASYKAIERARQFLPGGNTRSVLFFKPFPFVVARSAGCRIWDIDGNAYVDFLGEYTAGLFGHSDPTIKAAIITAVENGWVHGGHIEAEGVLAEVLCNRFPSIEHIRFCNSGTEANLMALVTARCFTGRSKIMAFNGGYHGGVLLFKNGPAPQNAPFPVVLGSYNETEATLSQISSNAADLAAVIIEPMQGAGGCVPADPEFLKAIRNACTKHGIILIYDEVMTSRLAPGGLQEALEIFPDMTTLGKYIGGGASFGAFGGRKDIMSLYDPFRPDALAHAGTFNNNAITMSAAVAAMTKVYTPEKIRTFNAAGDGLRARLNEVAKRQNLPVQFTGRGSMMNIHFTSMTIRNAKDADASSSTARALFHMEMLEQGQYCARRGMINLSLPMTGQEHDGFVAAASAFFEQNAQLLAHLPDVSR